MRIGALGVLTIALASIAGCGGGGGDAGTVATTTVPKTSVTTYGGVPGRAQSLSCEQDVKSLQQVSDLYKSTHGSPAPSIQQLVDDGYIDHAPTNDHGYVIAYDASTGTVTASGACTDP